ncbi:uncharacterized protein ACLA_015640 [Aspergillus clavatus NRRL 1]|uniref:Solid-state culture expressed protein (Aos23), putative n=1 Tax=Aspergillus clavatus (strain ATCC 1007 / CBS 513.65 / DSM 816 / NCTC 3887 / NRRL 1 / QM 1276 / 107) TaxID=344612 RepID=A1CBK4_ASPCL|nr:solid-state culture expressed protein (Aos23), putative [Aspergillus clavatus NRRL 1]EAW13122.1 solid-state culture expressed protein (Aos23), putative [Aspergillus clavatus NRRL 1]
MEAVQKAIYDTTSGIQNLAFGTQPETTPCTQQHGEEPLSGVQGRGTATDPYDAGNRDEQPDAPATKDNTAVITEPLESITPLENKPTDPSPASGAGLKAGATPSPAQEKLIPSSTNSATETGPGNPIVDLPSPAQEQTNPTASANSNNNTSSSNSNSNNLSEPRSISQSQPNSRPLSPKSPKQRDLAMSEGVSSSRSPPREEGDASSSSNGEHGPPQNGNVSIEALKGPQGPAPKETADFEQEMDGGKPSNTTGSFPLFFPLDTGVG